jgi:hypothetical protein
VTRIGPDRENRRSGTGRRGQGRGPPPDPARTSGDSAAVPAIKALGLADIRLTVRSPPLAEEGLPGWLLRLMELNGYRSPLAIERIAGLQRGRAPTDRESVVGTLAAMTGTDPVLVERIVPPRLGPSFRRTVIPGLRLPRTMFDANPKFCAECLRERAILPAAWDLTAWTACPVHGCLLSDRCPTCDEPATWRRAQVLECGRNGCRGRFTDNPTTSADQRLVALSTLLAERIDMPRGMGSSPFGSAFAELADEDLFLLVGRLGRVAASGLTNGDASGGPAMTAAKLLCNWPQSLRDFARSEGIPEGFSAHSTSDFPRIKFLISRNTRISIVSDAVRDFVTRAFLDAVPEAPLKHFAGAVPAEAHAGAWMSLRAASGVLSMHWRSVTRLAFEGVLRSTTVKTASNTFLYLDRCDVERMASRTPSRAELRKRLDAGDLVRKSEAARRLGVQAAVVRALAGSGHLVEVGRVAGSDRTLICSRSLDKLLGSLATATARNPDGRHEGPFLSLPQVVQTRRGLTFQDLIGRIRDGRLHPDIHDRDQAGLRAFLFQRGSLSDLDAELRRVRGVVTVREAATELVCSPLDVKRLVWSGLLRGDVFASEIEEASLTDFRARHVCIRELSTRLGKRKALIERKLAACGHHPVLLPANRKKHCSFWLRSASECIIGTLA